MLVCSGATADDITNKLFSSRLGSCAEYVQQNATCIVISNAVPNHNFNASGHFATPFSTQNQQYKIPATPQLAAKPTPLSLQYDNAIFLNGIKLDLMAAGCYGVADSRIGCHNINSSYRYDPMAKTANFGTDEHNAHTQPDGTYHYHGNPMALFEQKKPKQASPVIGFAADGFPIFGSYINDYGTIRKARSSYQLKTGKRPGGPGWRLRLCNHRHLSSCNGLFFRHA